MVRNSSDKRRMGNVLIPFRHFIWFSTAVFVISSLSLYLSFSWSFVFLHIYVAEEIELFFKTMSGEMPFTWKKDDECILRSFAFSLKTNQTSSLVFIDWWWTTDVRLTPRPLKYMEFSVYVEFRMIFIKLNMQTFLCNEDCSFSKR